MSKGNLFLGFGRGSVGDVVFSHVNGEQVARARNRSPRNPQTPIQLLQRVCLKTTSSAYSMLQAICNHSFQGKAEGTESQAAFNKTNIDYFRNLLAFEINSGEPEDILSSSESNFAKRNSVGIEVNPYIVSDGKLSTIPVSWLSALSTPSFGINVNLGSATPTYQQVVDALGVMKGDQLTFLALSIDDTQEGSQFNGFEFGRVILEPSDGDMSQPFLSGSSINLPNEKNQGDFTFAVGTQSTSYYLTFYATKFTNTAQRVNSMGAATVILSRLSGSVWARSTQQLVVRSYLSSVVGHLIYDHGLDYLGDAVYSYMSDEGSSLYLNQASNSVPSVNVIVPATLSSVSVNGHELDPSAPNQATAPLTIVGSKSGGESSKEYKLALYRYAGGQPSTKVTDVTMTGSSATITQQSATNGSYVVCLLEDGEIVDTSATFSVSDE